MNHGTFVKNPDDVKRREEELTARKRTFFLAIVTIVIFIILFAVFARVSSKADKTLIPISVVALIAGVLFEGKRLSGKWTTLLYITLAALAFSLLTFLPGKRERVYNLEDHVAMWPYIFISLFAIFSVISHGEKVVPKFTEGITLIQSIAAIYWIVDFGILKIDNKFLYGMIIVGLLLTAYTLFHALTYATITRRDRLLLSIWSSVLMSLFAVDNIYRVYQNEQVENAVDITQGFYVALQFFLLGVSTIYIVQNLMMLLAYLPGKGTFFNAQYFRDAREMNDQHVKRYSAGQVYIGHSLICLILTTGVFAVNFYFGIIPRHMAIWAVFSIVPMLMSTFHASHRESRYSM